MNRFFLVALFAFTALSSSPKALAQIEQVGRDDTFDVATWNIKWFGSPNNGPSDDDRQVENVRNIMLGSGIELWAVQEIANAGRFQELLTGLGPDWTGELATFSGSQDIGYVWDTRVRAQEKHRSHPRIVFVRLRRASTPEGRVRDHPSRHDNDRDADQRAHEGFR